jgi:serine/threonine protein kinase
MDYVIQKRLCEIPNGGSNFVRARGYRNFPGDLAYRTIMDYCDGGDLDSLREAHSDQGIPEPVIWRIFEQLAKSAVVSVGQECLFQSWPSRKLLTVSTGNGTRQP